MKDQRNVRMMKEYNPPQDPLHILYQDAHILILSKPSGLLSVSGRGEHLQDSLQTRAVKESPQALLVHRLDMETSGVFLMAMSKDAQRNLGLQFQRRKTQKTYIARVYGRPKENEGLIDLPLRCDWDRRPIQMVCYEHGRSAQTKWKVLGEEEESGELVTRLELSPITGRSHQLRVHCKELGHSILGDPFYAEDKVYHLAPRLQLHAQSLTVHHPDGGKLMTFTDPVPF